MSKVFQSQLLVFALLSLLASFFPISKVEAGHEDNIANSKIQKFTKLSKKKPDNSYLIIDKNKKVKFNKYKRNVELKKRIVKTKATTKHKEFWHKNSNNSVIEEGIASWYNSSFAGLITASGSPYIENAYSAAHNSLPIPCIIKVTNLRNKKSVKVIVNDRGPYSKNERIIDLSKKAAIDLGFLRNGIAKVKIEYDHEQTLKLLSDPALYAQYGINDIG